MLCLQIQNSAMWRWARKEMTKIYMSPLVLWSVLFLVALQNAKWKHLRMQKHHGCSNKNNYVWISWTRCGSTAVHGTPIRAVRCFSASRFLFLVKTNGLFWVFAMFVHTFSLQFCECDLEWERCSKAKCASVRHATTANSQRILTHQQLRQLDKEIVEFLLCRQNKLTVWICRSHYATTQFDVIVKWETWRIFCFIYPSSRCR